MTGCSRGLYEVCVGPNDGYVKCTYNLHAVHMKSICEVSKTFIKGIYLNGSVATQHGALAQGASVCFSFNM